MSSQPDVANTYFDEGQKTPKVNGQHQNQQFLNRPQSDMWYPGLTDFKAMVASDFEERYQ